MTMLCCYYDNTYPCEPVGVGERDQHVRRQTDVLLLLHLSVCERDVILHHTVNNVETWNKDNINNVEMENMR